MNEPLTCGVCGDPIAPDGSGATYILTSEHPWQWVHMGCVHKLGCDFVPPPMSRENALKVMARARAAGRLREAKP